MAREAAFPRCIGSGQAKQEADVPGRACSVCTNDYHRQDDEAIDLDWR